MGRTGTQVLSQEPPRASFKAGSRPTATVMVVIVVSSEINPDGGKLPCHSFLVLNEGLHSLENVYSFLCVIFSCSRTRGPNPGIWDLAPFYSPVYPGIGKVKYKYLSCIYFGLKYRFCEDLTTTVY